MAATTATSVRRPLPGDLGVKKTPQFPAFRESRLNVTEKDETSNSAAGDIGDGEERSKDPVLNTSTIASSSAASIGQPLSDIPHEIELNSANMKPTENLNNQGCGKTNNMNEVLFGGLIETFLIEVYRCTACKTCFTQRSAIIIHVKLHHSKESPQNRLHGNNQSGGNTNHPESCSRTLSMAHEGSQFEINGSKDCPSPISNALNVLVGLGAEGTSVLIEEVTQRNTGSDGSTRSDLQSCRLDAPETHRSPVVYNLSEVSMPDRTLEDAGTSKNKDGDCVSENGSAVRLRTPSQSVGNDLLILDKNQMSPTVIEDIETSMEVILEAPRVAETSTDQRHNAPEETLDTNSDTLNDPETMSETLSQSPRTSLLIPVVIPKAVSHNRQDSLDIDRLVQSASESNPEAKLITVVTQSKDEDQTEVLQFKKGWKTNAMIPTAKSLGIISPFPKRKETRRKKFSCPTCSSTYYTSKLLKNHINKKHVRVNKFLCEICGLALATKAGVRDHVIAKHSNVELFQCDMCDYVTKHKKHFQNHAAKHSGSIVCRVCDQTFTSTAKLKQHCESSAHLNRINPLACQLCDYTTYKMDNLRVHMRKHTDQRPYKCTHCEYASRDASTLKVRSEKGCDNGKGGGEGTSININR